MSDSKLPSERQPIGYAGLVTTFGLDCPLPRQSLALAPIWTEARQAGEQTEWRLLPRRATIKPPSRRIDHLGIALKHEAIDLRILSRLFAGGIESELVDFVRTNPNGRYTRRAWFLYEWMTGRRLDLPDLQTGQYLPVLDPARYFTRSPVRSPRHKVDDNMPGLPGFCPIIRRTERLTEARFVRLRSEAAALLGGADPVILRRAMSFMLLNESRGSFGIEGETPPRTRLERWGQAVAAAGYWTLSIAGLEASQRSLFDKGQRFVRLGLRDAGGFVGQRDPDANVPVPDHVSARAEDLQALLTALIRSYSLLLTDGFEPILLAATLGFGFVFIHPFEDGNGRLHRFLIQKALIDGGFSPPGVVLPVSAAILDDLVGYRAILEDYSRPTMLAVDWEPTADGNVEVLNDTSYLYRYFDATRQAEYLTDRIEHTIQFAVPAELQYLKQFDDAKRRIADVADLPDRLAGLLIQFCIQNGGTVSARKRAEFFPDAPADVMAALEQAVRESGIVPDGTA